jgi:hypothetical protein
MCRFQHFCTPNAIKPCKTKPLLHFLHFRAWLLTPSPPTAFSLFLLRRVPEHIRLRNVKILEPLN